MTHDVQDVSAPDEARRHSGSDALIYGLFFFSGISGLMYQVVWVRMLGRVLGNTVYATATILAAFMAGLALGSFLAGRIVDRRRQPLRFYAALEVGIALMALLSIGLTTWPAPLYQAMYDLTHQSRAALLVGQVIVSAAALLIPTALMGATLPALTAHCTRRTGAFSRNVGVLYAVNTLGAMTGTLAAGFVLVGAIGESRTILLGAVLNAAVAVVAWAAAGRASADAPLAAERPDLAAPPARYSPGVRRAVLACCAGSGLVVVAMEVVWGRMLILFQDTSIYAFSAMLTAVLGGIGAGSLIGASLAGRAADPLRLLARLVLAMAVLIVAGLWAYERLPVGMFLPPLIIVAPVALLSGIAFPVFALCYRAGDDSGRNIGTLYAWNTVGCIVGPMLSGFLLVPWLGSSRTGAMLGIACGVIALALLAAAQPRGVRWSAVVEAAVLAAVVVLALRVSDPYRSIMFRRIAEFRPEGAVIYRHAEDATAAVTAFTADRPGIDGRSLWVNGYGMTTLLTLTKMMAHLPIWLADDPRDVAVICFGMGTTFRSAVRHHDVNVTAVELVPTVADCFGYYHADADAVLAQPNARVVVDDGRNYLAMRPQQYDVITVDPAPPLHAAGTVNLYTRQFFDLCRSRTRDGGVVCLWIPPAEHSEVAMICRTFADVFQHILVWSPHRFPGLFLLGSHRPVTDVADRITRGYQDARIVADIREWDDEVADPQRLLSWYVCTGEELRAVFPRTPVITDDQPWTEFPLWRMRRLPHQPQLNGETLSRMLEAKFPMRAHSPP